MWGGVAASRLSPGTVLSVFWVQVLLGALFLLGAILICAYCRWQPCKPVVTGKFTHVLQACITERPGVRVGALEAPRNLMQKGKLREEV